MSTIVIDGFITLGVVLSLCLIYAISKPVGKKNTVGLAMRFNELATKNNLFITNKDILGNLVIGLDRFQKKIMIVKQIDDKYDVEIIHLGDIAGCSGKLMYKQLPVELAGIRQQESLLDRMVLECSVACNGKQVQIPFYVAGEHPVIHLPEMKRKLKK